MTPNDLQDRTFRFALAILALCDLFPGTVQGRTVSAQLAKCGTAVGANYRAARRSRSRREFVAKLGVVKEEADESEYWLELALAAGLVSNRARVTAAYEEACELRAIFVTAHRTAKTRLARSRALAKSRKSLKSLKSEKSIKSLDP